MFIIFLDDPFYFYKVLNFIFDFSNLTVPSLFLVDMDKVFLDLFIESTSGFIVFFLYCFLFLNSFIFILILVFSFLLLPLYLVCSFLIS